MGWRYRKRIKILPGIHINISKNGISTNVGVKGASITFGPKGTYVNTGIPGTGLYQRDRVSGKSQYQLDNQSRFLNDSSEDSPLVTKSQSNKRAKALLFIPPFYFLYLLSLILPFICYGLFCLGYLNMLACCLIIGIIQIGCYALIANYYSTAYDKLSKEEKKSLREEIRNHQKREIQAHSFGYTISIIIAICSLLPLISMNGDFIAFLNRSLGIYQRESTWIILLFSTILLFVWLHLANEEKRQIESLKIRFKAINNDTILENHKISPQNNHKFKDGIKREEKGEDTPVDDIKDDETTNKSFSTLSISEKVKNIDSNTTIEETIDVSETSTHEFMCDYGDITAPYDPKKDLENYHYPTLDLLKKYENDVVPPIDMEEQNSNKNRIVDVLRYYGIEISSIKATVGPRFSLYEITPAPGVSINKVRGLEDDLALTLSVHGLRIIAPIPGKGTVGIEVPNVRATVVSMESILNSRKFQESTMDLPCAIGKTITNEVFMFDLTKTPHVLIAGSTGQGKSVAVNTIITSLLYKKHPAEIKFVLMDPCVIELGVYSVIEKHFLAVLCDEPTVVTKSSQAVSTLNSLCKEMETRYDLLKMAFARNIKEYNRKFKDRQLNPAVGHRFMPYIVVIIDEYASFLSEMGTQFEEPLLHLAQLARAVGIHMIITTKRPTNDIISGAIKANFPTRISFRVPESVDSRVILDRDGAERLLGNGDMLYYNGDVPIRVQCAFVDTPETERICMFISQQQGYLSAFELPDPYFDESEYGGEFREVDLQHLDPMFEDAARLIVMNQEGSTSLIQRKFAIGYNRAGRLMDQLEKAGIVGAAHGSKPREVLIMDETSLENLLSQWKS